MSFDAAKSGVNLDQVMKHHAAHLVKFLDHHFSTQNTLMSLDRALDPAGFAAQPESQAPQSQPQAQSESPARHESSTKLARGLDRLLESMRYSLLQDGGKRFRPVLAMMTSEALGHSVDVALPIAAAVECVHTYSLIHDDLPPMDNDDFRRGAPTNHKKFEESTAILAGDALLTEAFLFLTQTSSSPNLALRAVAELSRAAGVIGMVGGQAIDMNAKAEAITIEELRTMHRLKTGALIRVSAVGAAILAGASAQKISEVSVYADNLGLAFQVADDILDFEPAKIEPGSYPALLGIEKTHRYLAELTDHCLESLRSWPVSADPLRALAVYNRDRKK